MDRWRHSFWDDSQEGAKAQGQVETSVKVNAEFLASDESEAESEKSEDSKDSHGKDDEGGAQILSKKKGSGEVVK